MTRKMLLGQETTLDKICSPSYSRNSTLLVSLDLSAAFDSIDHAILLSRLKTSEMGFNPIMDSPIKTETGLLSTEKDGVINAIESSTEIKRNEKSSVSRVGGRKKVIESGKTTCFSSVTRSLWIRTIRIALEHKLQFMK